MSKNKGNGKCVQWLRDHASHTGKDCLHWPYMRNQETGYCMFGLDGEILYAHRYMCELAHGHAPSDEHQAAHSCGKGHLGCLNPQHLSWKTISENLADKKAHRSWARYLENRLTTAQVAEVRALKGTMSQYEIAKRFGVKRSCIQYWHKHDRNPVRTEQNAPSTLKRRAMIARVRQSFLPRE